MRQKSNRREFIKKAALSGVGIGLAGSFPAAYANSDFIIKGLESVGISKVPVLSFIPRRAASWWCTIEDLQWSQKAIVDKIKRRAAAFAAAEIDTAVNFGFHIRFDFSNYFGQLHGYYANVCEELHKYNIKFMDHYSCNHVERPRGEAEFKRLHRIQRHHTLLFHDPIAAEHAQYEGHYFKDLCEVDLRDGSRGYSPSYQFETFCHNNPDFLDMHAKYLQRLVKEVPFDGIQVDDMCMYAGLTTCGCKYCRERFKRDYQHEIPTFGEKGFWGDVTKTMYQWGNYESPAFRDWLRMKTDGIVDHVKMVKNIIGNRPLMSCCSSTGPMHLNVLALDLEKMSPHLDFFMLENVGMNVKCVDWVRMDAEALHQKDIAEKRGNAPTMALSYTIYEKGGYLGWSLSRFWGVVNWSSTLNQRLEEDPADAMEMEDVIGAWNKWEVKNSNLDYREGKDLVECRLVTNRYCRENGWRDEDNLEHWDRVKAWTGNLIKNNVGYRFVRSQELSDNIALSRENTPLILDGLGCVSDKQFAAIKSYLAKGGAAWLALPFGSHDEKGFKRASPLSSELTKGRYKNLTLVAPATKSDDLKRLISEEKFKPVMRQLSGDARWAARIRLYAGKPVIHFMNTALIAIPHPTIKDHHGQFILKDIDSAITDNDLKYEVNMEKIPFSSLSIMSPELGTEQRLVRINKTNAGYASLLFNLKGIKAYAVVQ
jgi:hypothetical protein